MVEEEVGEGGGDDFYLNICILGLISLNRFVNKFKSTMA